MLFHLIVYSVCSLAGNGHPWPPWPRSLSWRPPVAAARLRRWRISARPPRRPRPRAWRAGRPQTSTPRLFGSRPVCMTTESRASPPQCRTGVQGPSASARRSPVLVPSERHSRLVSIYCPWRPRPRPSPRPTKTTTSRRRDACAPMGSPASPIPCSPDPMESTFRSPRECTPPRRRFCAQKQSAGS